MLLTSDTQRRALSLPRDKCGGSGLGRGVLEGVGGGVLGGQSKHAAWRGRSRGSSGRGERN